MKIAKEIKIAVVAIAAIIIFYVGFNYLKGVEFFDPTNEYYAIYDHLNGLTVSNPVLLSGLSIGRVSDIEILKERDNKVKVYFEVREDITLGKNTVALLSTDLLGTQKIVIQRNKVDQVLEDGSEVASDLELSLTSQIQEQAYPVLKTLDSVGNHLNGILSNIDRNEEVINGILADVKVITESFKAISAKERQVKDILDNFARITALLANEKTGLQATINKTNGVLDSLNTIEVSKMVTTIDSTMRSVNALIIAMNDGEGTIDKLISSDSMYNSLDKTLQDLDKLLIDFREQPKRYVHFSLFGKKDKDKDK